MRAVPLALVCLIVWSATGVSAPRRDTAALAEDTAAKRRFEINFGEPMHVASSKFWITSADGRKSELEFDRSEPIARTIGVFVPDDRRGKVILSWQVTPVEGAPSDGELRFNLE